MTTKHYWSLVFWQANLTMRAEISRTYLSFLWWFIEPIILMAIYYVVFGLFLQRNADDFVAFLLIGLVVWQWFANSLSHATTVINANKNVIINYKVPKSVFVLSTVLTDSYKFLAVLFMLMIFLWMSGYEPGESLVYLPAIVITEGLLIVGLAMLVAVVATLLPDVGLLIPYVLRSGMYLSGIIYAVKDLPLQYQIYFDYNPMWLIVNTFRYALIGFEPVSSDSVTLLLSAVVVSLLLGIAVLKYFDQRLTRAAFRE